jgi:hypothetical protein
MKRYFLFISIFLSTLAGCKKEGAPNQVSSLSIGTITFSQFQNSTWNHITGGIIGIEIDASGSTSNRTSDSIDIKNVATYTKQLSKGVYDVRVFSRSQSVADTFIRFNAELKSLDVENSRATSLTAVSTDGLITIAKTLVKDNTVPVFKADTDSKTFNFGLDNGYYYIYVKNGVNGSISMTSKETGQAIVKKVGSISLTHYNYGLEGKQGSLELIVKPFVLIDEQAVSTNLVNVEEDTRFNGNKATFFIIADELGNIISETTYIKGTSNFKLYSKDPYEKERFNLFQINVSQDINTATQIVGYLGIKKGSTLTKGRVYTNDSNITRNLKINLKNFSGFDRLNISTDAMSATLNSLSDSTGRRWEFASEKIWVQMLNDNQMKYNFFDVTKGTQSFDLDANLLTLSPAIRTYHFSSSSLSLTMSAKKDKAKDYQYHFGLTTSHTGELKYYYPHEEFQEYNIRFSYSVGNFNYSITEVGSSIPGVLPVFNTKFTISGTTLSDYRPSPSGPYDFYHAHFSGSTVGRPFFSADMYSPSTSPISSIKFPDLSKYLGVQTFDLSDLKLKQFTLHQSDEFSEMNFPYPFPSTESKKNSKQVSQIY